jgi:hypothetical protein
MVKRLMVCLLVVGCAAPEPPPPPRKTVEGLRNLADQVVDCELKAANKYDDGKYTVTQLAQRIVGICVVELLAMRHYAGIPLRDAGQDLQEFKQAAEIVETMRKSNQR